MTEEKRKQMKERSEIGKKRKAELSKAYNDFAVDTLKQIIPRCKSCECNWKGVCKAAAFANVPPEFVRDRAIADLDDVCEYWSPSYSAWAEAERKAR